MANIVTTSKAIRFSKGSVAKIALAKAEEITTSPGVRVYGPYASVQIYLSDTIDGQSFATTKAMREYIDANFFYSGGGTGAGVQSVNGDTGPDVVLDAGDIGAATAAQGLLADTAVQPADIALEEGDFLVGGVSGNEKRKIIGNDIRPDTFSGIRIPRINGETGQFSDSQQLTSGAVNLSVVQRTGTGQGKFTAAVNPDEATTLGQLNKVVQVTGNKTLTLTENLSFQNVTAASTITIPTNASVAFPIGAEITVALESGTATIAAASGVTTVSLNNNLTLDTVGQVAVLKKTGTDKWFVEINGGA